MNYRIDHIAIGASTCEQGVTALQHALGVRMPAGGKHPHMSTHNCLARAGGECFIEIIAIDPDAPDPGRPRWFTLDDPATRARLQERARPLCWVVNTDDLDAVVAASPVDLGEVVTLSRGNRSWRLTVPRDGSLPQHGLLPAFIEWSPGPHPSRGMADLGLSLLTIELAHPQPEALQSLLRALGVDHLANVQYAVEPGLSFTLKTPSRETVVLA